MFTWNKDVLNLLELISIAFAGAAGIIGILAETRDKKETGKLNFKGKFTIFCLIVGTVFSIWFKSISKSIEEKENLAKQIKEDSIQNKRNEEYAIFQNKQDNLLNKQNQSLNSINSLSDQQLMNLISQNEILSNTKIITYPIKNLTFKIAYENVFPDLYTFPKVTDEDIEKFKKDLIDIHEVDNTIFRFFMGEVSESHKFINVEQCELNGRKLLDVLKVKPNEKALSIYTFLKLNVIKAARLTFSNQVSNETAYLDYDFTKEEITEFTIRLDFKQRKSHFYMTGINAKITPTSSYNTSQQNTFTMYNLKNSLVKVMLGDYINDANAIFFYQKKPGIKVNQLTIENIGTSRVLHAMRFDSLNVSKCIVN